MLPALVQRMRDHGDRLALIGRDGRSSSFAQLLAAAEKIPAARLRAVTMIPPFDALVEALGTWLAGGVLVPLPKTNADRFLTLVKPEERRFLDDTALVLSTSGSRGAPKAVALSSAGLEANIAAILSYLRLNEDDRVGVLLPLHYSYALVGQVLTAWSAGAAVVLCNDTAFAREQIEACAELRVSVLSSVASSFSLLCDQVEAGAKKPALRIIASAGGPLPLSLASRLRSLWPDAVIWNQYGLTEASPRVTAISDRDPAFELGSIGRPLSGITAHVAEDGELLISAPSVMIGYLDEPPLSGMLHTGDLVRADERGNLFHLGRKDDVVKCGGERVSLDEVASLFRDQVQEAVVVALRDALVGSRLYAFYTGSAEPKALKALMLKRISAAAVPRYFTRLDTLPRTESGKIDIPALRARAEELA